MFQASLVLEACHKEVCDTGGFALPSSLRSLACNNRTLQILTSQQYTFSGTKALLSIPQRALVACSVSQGNHPLSCSASTMQMSLDCSRSSTVDIQLFLGLKRDFFMSDLTHTSLACKAHLNTLIENALYKFITITIAIYNKENAYFKFFELLALISLFVHA